MFGDQVLVANLASGDLEAGYLGSKSSRQSVWDQVANLASGDLEEATWVVKVLDKEFGDQVANLASGDLEAGYLGSQSSRQRVWGPSS